MTSPEVGTSPMDGAWAAGHGDGASHIHCGKLQERVADVPRDRPVAGVCVPDNRASIMGDMTA